MRSSTNAAVPFKRSPSPRTRSRPLETSARQIDQSAIFSFFVRPVLVCPSGPLRPRKKRVRAYIIRRAALTNILFTTCLRWFFFLFCRPTTLETGRARRVLRQLIRRRSLDGKRRIYVKRENTDHGKTFEDVEGFPPYAHCLRKRIGRKNGTNDSGARKTSFKIVVGASETPVTSNDEFSDGRL